MNAITCKFGGTSVANAEQILKIKSIILSDDLRKFIVVSAPGKRNKDDRKITDLLYLAHETSINQLDPKSVLDIIFQRYREIIQELNLTLSLENDFNEILKKITQESADYAASRGEFLSAKIIANALSATFIDPANHIFFDEDGRLDETKTYSSLHEILSQNSDKKFVIPGFYGSDIDGNIKTFSRGGSDITGAIVARATKSQVYENWTDVSGLLMADPRIVKNPKAISEVTYTELRELSYNGAQVLHDEAIFPVLKPGIPVHIKNTNHPEDQGTKIVAQTNSREMPIVGIAGRTDFEAIFIRKTLMNKEIGFGRKLLEIIESNQLGFEHLPSGIDSLSIILNGKQLEPKRNKIIKEIQSILNVDELETFPNLALVAIVGTGMAHKPGIAATIFESLAQAKVNIRLIDQGASELNIIIGIENNDYPKAINAIYQAFVNE